MNAPKDYHRRRTGNPDFVELLIWEIPKEVKAQFKARCAQEGVTMKKALIDFMERYAQDA